ncbi:hypothetical protein KS4_17710 [Poriferisphaera corsica]|uniref:Uncharacterized protein n=1 Tax=Poriferisphaera corsica TaxID=2528020 RepID=A0A517YU02_9BACT|nr:hypothetical protein [Poriferisphaera corsica]QDU33715.1 hypothetical protein KS4_17710 [Poriferisphaera corsica]
MSSSVIKLICPNLQCRKVLSVPSHARGKSVRCRACGIRVTVPGKRAPQIAQPATTDDSQIIEATTETTEQSEAETQE